MREYIENLVNNKIPLNSGYHYIRTERIAIPVHKVTLGISKRRTTNLELVEEMVLRFVSIGINDIDTIADIMGLSRDILDITIGDLHVKNLAFHSSGKCLLMAKGKEALKNLSVSKREKDVLRNIYINAITGEIHGEKNRDYSEARVLDDAKVKHQINANSIELYRRKMSEISLIFEQSMKSYLNEDLKVMDELVSIDSVDDLSTGFILVPIHIYVTAAGLDIDIIARNRWQRSIIEDHKDIIIEQIRTRKLLSNLILPANNRFASYDYKDGASCEDQYQMLNSVLAITDENDFSTKAQEILFSSRKILDNELLGFCELVFNHASSIEMQVDDLNYWSKNSTFLTIGSFVSQKTHCRILYRYPVNDVTRAIKRIQGSCSNIKKNEVNIGDHSCQFRIIVDSKIQIDVFHEAISIFTKVQYIPKIVAHVNSLIV